MTKHEALDYIKDMLTTYFKNDAQEVITYKINKYLTTNNDQLGGKKPLGYLYNNNQQELIIFVAKQIFRGQIDK